MKRRNLRSLLRLASDNSGAAAVEFALVSTAFLMLVFGIAYLAIMLHHKATLQWAVENAIRTAAINTTVTQSQMQTTLNGYLTQTGMPSATVTYSVASGAIPVATLTASFSQNYTVPFISTFHITYSATAKTPQGG
jgi:Flp pilus assembly protein TadG